MNLKSILEKINTQVFKTRFHIFNAFVSESLRYSTFAPSLIPHKTFEDENIDSYDVPKDTVIIYNA